MKDHIRYRILGLLLMLLGAIFLFLGDVNGPSWQAVSHERFVFFCVWMGIAIGGGFATLMFSFKLDPNRPQRPPLGCPKCGKPIAMQVPFVHQCP